MELCSEHGFDSIAFVNSKNCPACEQIADMRKDYESQIDELNDQISSLEGENSDLADENTELQSEIDALKEKK